MTQQPMGSDWGYADEDASPSPVQDSTEHPSEQERLVREARQPSSSGGQVAPYQADTKATNHSAAVDPDDPYRRIAKQRVQERIRFKRSLNSFIGVNVMLWAIWLISNLADAGSADWHTPWPLWVTLFWGLGVFGHWRRVRNPDPAPAELEAQVEAEARRLRGD